MKIGICSFHLRIPCVHSLKEKRSVVKKISTKIKQNFNVSIAEIDNHDVWQTATLGIAVVSNDGPFLQGVIDKVLDYTENNFDGEMLILHTEVICI